MRESAVMTNRSSQMVAGAKLNLFLHVIGKREDGYHLLESAVAFTDFGDVLAVQDAQQNECLITGEWSIALSSADAPNSIEKVAEILRVFAPDAPAVRMTLEKNIPVSAGLGGGSVDAAAAMHLLSARWGLQLSPMAVEKIALQIGADVPVAYAGTPAMMKGIGEQLNPLPTLPSGGVLLVNPRVEVPTACVFRALSGTWSAPLEVAWPMFRDMREMAAWLKDHTRNDMEAAACELFPVVRDVLANLAALPNASLARMSGSGGTCFALFDTIESAQSAQQLLHAQQPSWWSVATHWKE